MSTLQSELDLFKQTLEWVKSKNLPSAPTFIPYYDTFFEMASTQKPILTEDWGKHNTRHGANSVRGTTSELLTVAALALPRHGSYTIDQVESKHEQEWGSDLKLRKPGKDAVTVVSVKTCKPYNKFVEGKLETFINVWRDWFKSAEWRVTYLSAVHPETKQVWLFNYGVIGNVHCTSTDRGFLTPTFNGASTTFSVTEFERKFPNALIYFDLRKDKEWTEQ